MSDPQASLGEWAPSRVPLGLAREKEWTPVGAGVLFIDAPLVWLVTAKSLLARTAEQPLAALVSEQGGGAVLDLSARRGTPLDWIEHPALDLAVGLFPIDPSWGIKAFPEARCMQPEHLLPGLPLQSLQSAYLPLGGAPLLLTGHLARADASGALVTTVPLLPQNAGTPLAFPLPAAAGGGVALAGILTGAPAGLPVSVAVAIGEAIGLVRSEAGKAQRRLALARTRPAAAEEGQPCSP